jgi:hypothetical protein
VGGKSSTSTQQVSIPPQVLAQYSAVNARANQTAQTPFQSYNGQFVAPINQEQTQGINQLPGLLNTANATDKTALGTTQASGAPLTGSQIDQYLSPYLNTVLGSTANVLNQNNQQQQAGQLGNAINQGAFGGDRTGIAAANLEQQQDLANSQIYSGIANQGYQSALGTAQGQQQIGLQAGAQEAQIGQQQFAQGQQTAQAEIGAGTLEQQTQQAKDTALYNQFLQKQSYPFQVDQFLANIAEGTGALSGSTTTTSQPGGFFSDVRLKHDIKKIGKTYDGQSIYSYKMHGDPRTHVGLIAQEVEKKKPEAVGLASGFKTVDYGKATEKAADRGHFATGGGPSFDLAEILAAQQAMYAPITGGGPGAFGLAAGSVPRGGSSRVPAPTGGSPQLITAQGSVRSQPTGMQNINQLIDTGSKIQAGYDNYEKNAHKNQPTQTAAPSSGVVSSVPAMDPSFYSAPSPTGVAANDDYSPPQTQSNRRGGVVGLASGGIPYSNVVGAGSTELGIPTASGRSEFASGGSPYSWVNDYSELAIPDENSHNQMIKAPDLPKQAPTGFQQLMSGAGGMGSMGGNISSMFSSGAGGAGGAAADSGDDFSGVASSALAGAEKRGGRIRRDTGGDAVTSNSADRNSTVSGDEPDTSLQTAAPPLAQAAPNTSLDSVKHLALAAGEAYFGDYAGAAGQLYDAYGASQTNNHRRGGRIHKDDGGGLGMSPDPDVNPQDVVWSGSPLRNNMGAPNTIDLSNSPPVAPAPKSAPRVRSGVAASAPVDAAPAPAASPAPAPAAAPSGVAAADLSPVGVDPTADQKVPEEPQPDQKKGVLGSIHDWWERNKTDAIPAIQGLAAMGMYPTKHLGVALAAGLGAGAQSYFPTQQAAQDVQARNLQNQLTGLGLDVTRKSLGSMNNMNPSAGASDMGSPPTERGAAGAAMLTQYYNKKNYVPPMTPEEAQAKAGLQVAGGAVRNPGLAAQIDTRIQQRINTAHAQNQLDMQNKHDAAYEVAIAPSGNFAALRTTDPTAATAIAKQMNFDPTSGNAPPDADAAAKEYAMNTVTATHPWTGDKYEDNAGREINSRTGRPTIGPAAQALTPEQQWQQFKDTYASTETGAPAREAFINWVKQNGGGNIPTNWQPQGGWVPNAGASAAGAQRPGGGATQRSTTPTTEAPGAPGSPAKGSSLDFSDAAPKPAWLDNPHRVPTVNMDRVAEKYATAEQSLYDEANRLEGTQQAIVKAQRALQLLPNAKTGPGTTTMSAIQTALGNMTGSQFVSWLGNNPAAHDILAKSLGTGALETAIEDLKDRGAQIRLGNQESNLIINRLAASTEMPKAAIEGLLNWQIQQGQYDVAKESAIPHYLAQGKDARAFDGYYSRKFPLSSVLSTAAPAGTTINNPMPAGPKLQAYADAHFKGDRDKAQQYLKKKGYQ